MEAEAPRFIRSAPYASDVAEVRHWMAKAVATWALPQARLEDALLIVSELATNSIRHAQTAFEVVVSCEDDVLRIEVFDRDTRLPLVVGADTGATSGRGLQIVNAIADEWGSHTDARDGVEGKVVWAQVSVEGDRGPNAAG